MPGWVEVSNPVRADELLVGPGEKREAFLDKLTKLQDMNARLRHEARALHRSLKEELLRLRSENRRMGGYRGSAIVTPMNSLLVSRRG